MYLEIYALTIRKELADGEGLNRLRRVTDNEAWLTDIPQSLNSMDFSREKFQDNIIL